MMLIVIAAPKSEPSKNSIYAFFFLFLFKATTMEGAYGSSKARGLIIAVAASLHHSYSNAES